jgi:integrase
VSASDKMLRELAERHGLDPEQLAAEQNALALPNEAMPDFAADLAARRNGDAPEPGDERHARDLARVSGALGLGADELLDLADDGQHYVFTFRDPRNGRPVEVRITPSRVLTLPNLEALVYDAIRRRIRTPRKKSESWRGIVQAIGADPAVTTVRPEHELPFRFLAATGLRISELVGLRWSDLDFGAGAPGFEGACLRVRWQDRGGELCELKSERSRRRVPVAPGMAAELWAAGADRPGDRCVFTNAVGGPLQRHNMHNRLLDLARERAGLPWASFHSFRHTCASLLF